MDYINLKSLTLEELAGVINLYPWFGGARMELCRRMAVRGGEDWGREQYAQQAVHIGARHKLAALVRAAHKTDCSDKDLAELLKQVRREEKQVKVVGGDYFSQAQYDSAREKGDGVFSSFAAAIRKKGDGPAKETSREDGVVPIDDIFCTETVAAIYAEQGYFEQAKHIYSKLLLAFPEKNAYFAALISKLG